MFFNNIAILMLPVILSLHSNVSSAFKIGKENITILSS